MANAKSTTPAAKAKTAAKPVKAQQATTPPAAPQTQPAAPTVALRGGPAVQQVKLTGKLYRTGAKHNAAWWATITQAASTGPATVQALVAAQVPTHFIGYAMRRGYLQAA